MNAAEFRYNPDIPNSHLPIRKKSVHGKPPRRFGGVRGCTECGADFIALSGLTDTSSTSSRTTVA